MSMPAWIALDKRVTAEHLGFVPSFLDDDDPDDAATQLDKNYAHGGGFRQTSVEFEVSKDYMSLQYPGDPPYRALAVCPFRGEMIFLYDYGWVLVRKRDGSRVIARMD